MNDARLCRIYHNVDHCWEIIKNVLDGLPARDKILEGSESFSIAGFNFDRYNATPSFAEDDVANLADLDAFDHRNRRSRTTSSRRI